MKAMSLYGQRVPAAAVKVADGAPLTLYFRREASSSMKVTSRPSSGAVNLRCWTCFFAASARVCVQNVRQPGRERHSQGMLCSSMYALTVL